MLRKLRRFLECYFFFLLLHFLNIQQSIKTTVKNLSCKFLVKSEGFFPSDITEILNSVMQLRDYWSFSTKPVLMFASESV